MFKFMKSKKGFTLVELMIVVVIMAILVAVAVPIYSAVTDNAKKKTCAANRREIVSQLNTYFMGSDGSGKSVSSTVSLVIAPSTSEYKVGKVKSNSASAIISDTDFGGLFQAIPCCPSGSDLTVKISATSTTGGSSTPKVSVTCTSHAD